MFHKPQLDKKETTIDSLIGKKIHLHGDVIFEGGLRLDGQVTGNLRAKEQQTATLVISEQARVHGDVHVTHLVLNGYIEGNVNIHSLLELQPQAHIKGDVHYVMLEMHQGAIVEGRLIHTPSSQKSDPNLNLNSNLNNVDHSEHQLDSTNSTNSTNSANSANLASAASLFTDTNTNTNTVPKIEQLPYNNDYNKEILESDINTNENTNENINKNITQEKQNTIEQLQNKLAEGFSFLKGK